MKKTASIVLAALMMVVFLVGCGGNGGNGGGEKSDVVGTWITEKVGAAGQEYTVEEYKEILGEDLGKVMDMSFHFKEDGKVSMETALGSTDGTWTEEGDKVTAEVGSKMEFSKKDGKLTLEQSGATITFAKK